MAGIDIFDKYKEMGEWAFIQPMGSPETYIGCIQYPKGLPDDQDATIALLLGGIQVAPLFDYAVQIQQDRNGNVARNEACMPHNLSAEIDTPVIIKPSIITLYKHLSTKEKRNFEKLIKHAEAIILSIRGEESGVKLVTSMPPELAGGGQQGSSGKPSILKI